MILEQGTIINSIYRVKKLLGKGGMGNVYLVERIKDKKLFVVKELIFTATPGMDEHTAREIFHREAEFMVRFEHPGIPKMYGIFSNDDKDYLTMDYVEGQTLEEIINSSEKPVEENKAVKWTIELTKITDYLHNHFEKPIVYRDFKPSNIIITPEGNVKLVDFGIARYYNPDKNTDTFSYGSPGYAAPEQYKGRGQSCPQTDIFSLGVVLFQMLTKYDPTVKPFTFPDMKELNPRISNDLKKITLNAIHLNPVKRYISMSDFQNNLEKYIKKPYAGQSNGNNTSYQPQGNPQKIDLGSILFIIFLSAGYTIFISSIVFFIFFLLTLILGKSFYEFIGCGIIPLVIIGGSFIFSIINIFSSSGGRCHHMELMLPIAITAILYSILIPNFLKSRALSLEKDCENNLKNISTAIALYSEDYGGKYPPSLDKLLEKTKKGAYINKMPMCPACNIPYTYEVSKDFNNFTAICSKPDVHIPGEIVPSKGNWPQYSPGKGIKKGP